MSLAAFPVVASPTPGPASTPRRPGPRREHTRCRRRKPRRPHHRRRDIQTVGGPPLAFRRGLGDERSFIGQGGLWIQIVHGRALRMGVIGQEPVTGVSTGRKMSRSQRLARASIVSLPTDGIASGSDEGPPSVGKLTIKAVSGYIVGLTLAEVKALRIGGKTVTQFGGTL